MGPTLSDRLRLVRAEGGLAASAYWLMSRVLRIHTHKFYAIELDARCAAATVSLPDGYAFICIAGSSAMAACDERVMAALDRQNGTAVADVIARGGRMYAIVRGTDVITQQRVDFASVKVDSPHPMELRFGERDAFFSYLHTQPAERGRGWATRVVTLATQHLASEGWRACVCHIRASNVVSLATLAGCGWQPVALLYSLKRSRRSLLLRLPIGRRMAVLLRVRPA